jgi:RecJ-like exonuclease
MKTDDVPKQELKCPKCRKSDKIVVRCQKGPGGDWHVYDCERCDREVHAERVK